MRFLLDTHTLIRFFNGDKELSQKAKYTIENISDSICFVSIATILEMAIKIKFRKLEFKNFDKTSSTIAENNFEILPISFQSAFTISALPLHHRYPFDRILIAQAIEENLTIITKNKNFSLYKNIKLLW